jgi:hypothetical protein
MSHVPVDEVVITRIDARTAHHEAGHAVAAVVRGGKLVHVHMESARQWDGRTEGIAGVTRHMSHRNNQPFVIFAGVWADAKWQVSNEPDIDGDEPLDVMNEYLWPELNFAQGDDGWEYESRVLEFESLSAELGFSNNIPRSWEFDWANELNDLWPAICAVATMILEGMVVDHDAVTDAIDALIIPTR